MARTIATVLMFEGAAEAAMKFYVSLFPGAAIETIERYGPGESGVEGSVKLASFQLAGQNFRCIDSSIKHAFSFTPSISIAVDCESVAELDATFAKLSAGGAVLMPPDNYGFSTWFGWATDRYGVSWQLNVE
jgi:predicted 3-demethylubiquinone-9 3-methyltransferase (glyoxalase superfamily)